MRRDVDDRCATRRRVVDPASRVPLLGRPHALWIGGGHSPVPDGVGLIVSVAPDLPPARPGPVEEVQLPFADTQWEPVPRGVVEEAIRACLNGLRTGDVLVRCAQGINRSSLIAALVLRETGHGASGAIAMVRACRSPLALCNPYFAELVTTWPADPLEDRDA